MQWCQYFFEVGQFVFVEVGIDLFGELQFIWIGDVYEQ